LLPLQVFHVGGKASESIYQPIPFEVVINMPAELGGSKVDFTNNIHVCVYVD